MQLNFEVEELAPFPAFVEPTQIFPTVYFDRQIYAATVPRTLFSEGTFCQNSAQISLEMDPRDCLELLQREQFYVVLNTLSPPKKAKKANDGVSYAELVLLPFEHTAAIKVGPFDGTPENGVRRISMQLEIPVYAEKSTLKVRVDGHIPDFSRFLPIQVAFGGIRIGGNLENVQAPLVKGFPPCEWESRVYLPGGREISMQNGYLRVTEPQVPTQIESMEDFFAVSQPKETIIEFPATCAYSDVKAAEIGYKALYALLGDAKTAEKQCTAEFAEYNAKALQYCLKSRGQAQFVAALETLRDAVEAALTNAVLDKNERVLEELQKDPKKKVDTKGMLEAVKVVIEHSVDFLATEVYENNYLTLFLDETEVQAMRGAKEIYADISVVPSAFWADFQEIDVQELKCVGKFDFSQCLRIPVITGDVVLHMTPEQIELAAKPLESSQKDKKKPGQKDEARKYENVLQSNYSSVGVALNFSMAGIIRTRAHFVAAARSELTDPELLFKKSRTNLIKKLLLSDELPPSRESLSPRDEVLQQLRFDIERVFGRIGVDGAEATLNEIAGTYVEQLRDVIPQASSAEVYATIITTARTALSEAENVRKTPQELVDFGNILLQSNSVQDAERAMSLFGTALTRERAQSALFEHTETLEASVLGSLKCAILSKDDQLLERNICRVYAISELDNKNMLLNFELAMLAAAEVLGTGESEVLALLFLHFYRDIYVFDSASQEKVKENLLLMTFVYAIFEHTKNQLFDELKLLLTDYLREVNTEQRYFSNVFEDDADDLVILNLKLALVEWLVTHNSLKFAQTLLGSCALQKFDAQRYSESSFEFVWKGRFEQFEAHSQEPPLVRRRPAGCADSGRQLATKIVLLQARIYYLAGEYNEMRHILLKPRYLQKKPRTQENNPLNLLSYMQNDEQLEASFLDLLDDNFERVPGVLAALALSCAHAHRIPQFLYYCGKLPQILICAALRDMLPSKPMMSISTANDAQVELGRKSAIELIANMEKKFQGPEGMVVAPETVADLEGMTFELVVCNSRVSYEIALQAVGYASQGTFSRGYTGELDAGALCINILQDSVFTNALARLAVRYLPLFKMLQFSAPFSRPEGDEINIAKRIFEQIGSDLTVAPHDWNSVEMSYTTDFLAALCPKDGHEIAALLAGLLGKACTTGIENPQLLSTYGQLILRAGRIDDALQAFQRALQLDANDGGAWRGIALVMAYKIGRENDFQLRNKMRDKILECLERAIVQPTGYAAVAIAQALLSTTSERATMYALAAAKLLRRETYSPLTPIIPFDSMAYECDFQNAEQTQWYVSRLLAIAAKSCGRPEDVAQHMQEALEGMGGAKPGRSVQEIAERILLMTETSQAWNEAGEVAQAEKIMADGLI